MFGPPPTLSTPLICGMQMPWIRAMCVLIYDITTLTPHSLQLTRAFFLFQKVSPSTVACWLCAVSPHFSQLNPGIHTISLVFFRLVSSPILWNISTVTVNTSWTHS